MCVREEAAARTYIIDVIVELSKLFIRLTLATHVCFKHKLMQSATCRINYEVFPKKTKKHTD